MPELQHMMSRVDDAASEAMMSVMSLEEMIASEERKGVFKACHYIKIFFWVPGNGCLGVVGPFGGVRWGFRARHYLGECGVLGGTLGSSWVCFWGSF